MRLALVGVSHRSAPVELRERVAVELDAAAALSRTLAGTAESVVLSTCNRTEIYVAQPAGEPEQLAESARAQLAAGADGDLARVAYRLVDESAALHLFRVAAGLDSLVPGEGEILGQVRDAFEAGSTGPLLDRVFRMALHAGRRARVETAIGESPSSVPAAAAALAQQVFDGLTDRRVVLVGAGRMSDLTARNLRSRGAVISAVGNRSVENAQELATRHHARAVTLEELGTELAEADIVVASTSAPGFVLRLDELGRELRGRRGRPLLLVDLAVPRDIDPALATLDGCFVYDIDDLEAVVASSLEGRRAEALRAERIVAAEAERFREWQASLAVVPAIASLRAWAEAIRNAELERLEGRLGALPDADRKLVETATAQIVNKLLHLPTVRLKEAAVTADGVLYADAVRHLFGLEDDER